MITYISMIATASLSTALIMLSRNNILLFVVFGIISVISFGFIEYYEHQLMRKMKNMTKALRVIDRKVDAHSHKILRK